MTTSLIRPATVADVPLLCQLGGGTFRETYRTTTDLAQLDDYVATHFSPERVEAWFRQPRTATLVAQAGGTPVGYAHVRGAEVPACVSDRQAVELSRLYLLASAQGTGLGSVLLAAALEAIGALGGRTVWLGAYDRNHRALAFYEKHRFARVGTHEFEFGGQVHADLVLTRALHDG